MLTNSYLIPEVTVADLKVKIEKMARKCVKLGLEECSMTVGESEDIPYVSFRNLDGNRVTRRFKGSAEALANAEAEGCITYRRFVNVTVTGPAPVLAGWEFVATLNHLQDDTGATINIINTRPDFSAKLPERFRTASPYHCDHCQTERKRNDTYVVRNVETNEFKQVGRTCLKDFCGGNDPRAATAALQFWFDIDTSCTSDSDFEEGLERQEYRFDIRSFLAMTSACTREFGWVSRTEARNSMTNVTATADRVWENLVAKAKEV